MQLPLPALTICPAPKFDRTEFNHSMTLITDVTPEMLRSVNSKHDLEKLSQIYNALSFRLDENRSKWIEVTKELENILEDIFPKDFIGPCQVNDAYYDDCSIFFNRFLYFDKLCYTFNQLSIADMFYNNV